jgi:hypothetical protein
MTYFSLAELWGGYNKYLFRLNDLATVGNSAGVGIIGSAAGNRHGAGLGDGDLGLGGGSGDLGRSGDTSENENGNESEDDVFHYFGLLFSLFCLKFVSS